ncbi:MAG: hypothetical protein OHK0052_21170 [Anaerolineales bacterium]
MDRLQLDRISFWAGFIAATLFWWLVFRVRPYVLTFVKQLRANAEAARQQLTQNTEERYRGEVLNYAQGQHLAAAMFSLDEITLPPQLMAPPNQVIPGAEFAAPDTLSELIPYLPDWPEFSAAYQATTLSLSELLQGGANLLVVGAPGSGKTVALAHLASLVARRDPKAGNLAELLPIFLHASDLRLPRPEGKTAAALLKETTLKRAGMMTSVRLPEVLDRALESGRVLLLLDGTDELPPPDILKIAEFLGSLLQEIPNLRVVTTAIPEAFNRLPSLGLQVVAMAAWHTGHQKALADLWAQRWQQLTQKQKPKANDPNPRMVVGWLMSDTEPKTPMECALKAWAAFAGDALGPTFSDALEAYLRRHVHDIPHARTALQRLAGEALLTMQPALTKARAKGLLSEFDPEAARASEQRLAEEYAGKSAEKESSNLSYMLTKLLNSAILVEQGDDTFRFAHPLALAYLSTESLGSETPLLEQPAWCGSLAALEFIASQRDVSSSVAALLQQDDAPLYPSLLITARWLRRAKRDAPWRGAVMRQLLQTLQDETLPLATRTRCLSGLVLSGDPNLSAVFRKLHGSPNARTRQLAALGSGYLADLKALAELGTLATDPESEVRRAACLALIRLNHKTAQEVVVDALTHGDEPLRQAVAEGLATVPGYGHNLLMECSTYDDLLVRRAAVFGLAKVRQAWATEILKKMQMEDAQWVVRNAAEQAVLGLNRLHPGTPRPLPALENTPWLIAFAAERGMGVSKGTQALEMLAIAARDGKEEQKFAAIYRIQHLPEINATMLAGLYQILFGPQYNLHNAVLYALWQLSSAGIELPPPRQFGLG